MYRGGLVSGYVLIGQSSLLELVYSENNVG